MYEVQYIAGFIGDVDGTSEIIHEDDLFDPNGRFTFDDDGTECVFFSESRLRGLAVGESTGPATFVTYTMAVKRIS